MESTKFEDWRYLESSNCKHLFYGAHDTTTLCGRVILWCLPASVTWLKDKEGLEKRKKCKTCVKIDGDHCEPTN
jgi:hypothetical protein